MLPRPRRSRTSPWALTLAALLGASTPAVAGPPYTQITRPVVATPGPGPVYAPAPVRYVVVPPVAARPVLPARAVRPTTRLAPTGMLGSFAPSNYITVRGNGLRGGGYSPLGSYGQTSMDLFGPFAALRETTAPVVGYSRGYDGRAVPTDAISFSTPFLPDQSPVVYPTKASNFAAPRDPGTRFIRPGSGMNWVDQN